MVSLRRSVDGERAEELAIDSAAAHSRGGGRVAAIISAVALALSVYSLWETTLKRAVLHAFVPPVLQYSAPHQNSNFEVIAIPLTPTNDGAQTGTVLSMELAVTDPRSNATKRFYSADFGRWTMERTRSGSYQPFAPISLAGRSSRTESVLFYARGEEEEPDQLIRETGAYRFTLRLEQAVGDSVGFVDRLWRPKPTTLTFERELRFYDARTLTNGALPLNAKDWRSTMSGAENEACEALIASVGVPVPAWDRRRRCRCQAAADGPTAATPPHWGGQPAVSNKAASPQADPNILPAWCPTPGTS
jgi:hypothetical protein